MTDIELPAGGLTVTSLPLVELMGRWHPDNPKGHNIVALIESIERFGFTSPVLICERTGMIASGHGRTEALDTMRQRGEIAPPGIEDLGEDWAVPVIRGWESSSDGELMAYLVADNRQTELGGWDDALLTEILRKVDEETGSFAGVGFSRGDLDLLLSKMAPPATAGEDDADMAPAIAALPDAPVTKRGDVWEIGPHRIMCGDCRNGGDVSQLLGGSRINVAVTSPPYAEQRKYDEKSEFEPIRPDDYVEWFEPVAANVAAHLADDGSWFVNIKPAADGLDTSLYVMDLVTAHVREWGWHFATEFCWERSGVPKQVTARFKNQFEPVYQFARARWKIRPEHVQHASESAIIPMGRSDADTQFENVQGSGRSMFLDEQKQPKRGKGIGSTSWNPEDATSKGALADSSRTAGAAKGWTSGSHEQRQGQGGAYFPPESKVSKRAIRKGVGAVPMSEAQGTPGSSASMLPPTARYNGNASAVQGVHGALGTGASDDIGLGWAYPGNRLPTFSGSHEAVGHSAAFPVGLPGFFVKAYSDEGDTVYDPFVGSGSTILAAHESGRVGYGMEISAGYVDVALARLQRVTGIKPVRNGVEVDFTPADDPALMSSNAGSADDGDAPAPGDGTQPGTLPDVAGDELAGPGAAPGSPAGAGPGPDPGEAEDPT